MSRTTTLISVTTFKERCQVHKNMDDDLIIHEIRAAQDMSIVEALGTNLLNRLLIGIEEENLTADEETLIDGYITDALIQFTLSGMVVSSSYQMFTKGLLRRTSENTELPSLSDMREIQAIYKDRGEFYRERLINYLRINKTLFPLYTSSDCATDDILPKKDSYTVPMWLNDSEGCGC